ncbi:hypothetical protein IL306_011852 [Fusarium sp. DS 682]|nr:hypothetical protein IL306_011852 [Fusarium sp. DS 682]
MQLTNIAAVTLLASSALAADCFGTKDKGITSFQDAYWQARQKMCSNSPECPPQEPCTTSGQITLGVGLARTTIKATLTRKYTGGKVGFKDCWEHNPPMRSWRKDA